MTITTTKIFSPSVNIARDFDQELSYIPTPNAQLVFNQITNNFILGIHSFNIIGAYGTGKSSFLWAIDKVLNQKKQLFQLHPFFQKQAGFSSINIIGDYASLVDYFANLFRVEGDYTNSDIIKAIDKHYQTLVRQNKGLILFIDEFGKFLEFAAKNKPEQELYFIQQLAEYINNVENNILLVTTLHQDFSSYALGLSRRQRNEWDKVKGRLKEIPFNEPLEQLLFLAAERLEHFPNKPKKNRNFTKLFKTIQNSKAFPLRDYLNEDIAEKLLPFDILAASILTIALQRYGQNERSLFSFIEAHDHLGINGYISTKAYYNISSVYDYLTHNYNVLNNRFQANYAQWTSIQRAIEQVEGLMEDSYEDAAKLIKVIGLLNIFAKASATLDDEFLINYGKLSLGIKTPKTIIIDLKKHKIIRFTKYSRKYVFVKGTDLDIDLEIDKAGNLVEKITNVVKYLSEYFEFPYLLAKAAYYEYGTPRFFEFRLSEKPIDAMPVSETDGFINLIFSENLKASDIQQASRQSPHAILYGWYKNTHDIRNLLFEIEKIKKVIEQNIEDKVAVRELETIKVHQIKLLNHYVSDAIYDNKSAIEWYFNGEKITFKNEKGFNRILSHISKTVYSKTPIFRNELVNKSKLSTAISTAQKKLIRTLYKDWSTVDLGFPKDKFPPEKTIYLSLLKETGLLRTTENGMIDFAPPTSESFLPLWEASEGFLESAKSSKRGLREFIDLLSHQPFKLKKGFIDFWLPIFLFAKREDFALFEGDVYVPYITDQVLEIVKKNPHKYAIKTFNVDGFNLSLFNRYRELLDQQEKTPSNQSFIETIKPFLTFYKGLPEFTKKTRQLSLRASNLKKAIATAKNPEQTFFEDFPNALKYKREDLAQDKELLDEYLNQLKKSLKEIRTAYDRLLDRFEEHILKFLSKEESDFETYKAVLQDRFKDLNPKRLQQRQRVFLVRINADLERNNWLNAICQACIGKPLDIINDTDELNLFEQFDEMVLDLDNLYELTKAKDRNEKDEFISVEFNSLKKGKSKQIVRMPTKKMTKVDAQIIKIKPTLGQDKDVNIAALTKVLNELLNHD